VSVKAPSRTQTIERLIRRNRARIDELPDTLQIVINGGPGWLALELGARLPKIPVAELAEESAEAVSA